MKVTDQLKSELIARPRIASKTHLNKLLSLLDKSELVDDPVYNMHLHLHIAYNYYRLSMTEQAIEYSEIAIKLAYQQQKWQSCVYLMAIMGNVYYEMFYFDMAVKYYLEMAKISKENNLPLMYGMGINNIGELYFYLSDYHSALYFCKLAYDGYEKIDTVDWEMNEYKMVYTYNLVVINLKLDKYIEALGYRRKMTRLKSRVDQNYYQPLAAYADYLLDLHRRDAQRAKHNYDKVKKMLRDNHQHIYYLEIVIDYCKRAIHAGDTSGAIIDELKSLDTEFNSKQFPFRILEVYKMLATLHEANGDIELAASAYGQYYQLFNYNMQRENSYLSDLINFRATIESLKGQRRLVARQEAFLQKRSQVARDKQKHLEQLNRKLNIINRVGRKLSATLDRDAIINYTFDEFRTNMPVDSYFLCMVNEKERQFLPTTVYREDQFISVEPISFDDTSSLLALCHRERHALISNDVKSELPYFYKRGIISHRGGFQSIVILPIIVEDHIIAYCSVQANARSAYSDYYVDILNAMLPFIGIALNNAQKSAALLKQVTARKQLKLELEQANSSLHLISEIDGMTQVANRLRFEREFKALYQQSIDQQLSITVMMIDIDFFKDYNDCYGHLKGDEVLKTVAQAINQMFRKGDASFARYGGEEFALVMIDIGKEQAQIIAQRLKDIIEDANIGHRLSPYYHVTISLGVYHCENPATVTQTEVIKRADHLLYQAKQAGRNRMELNA